MAVTAAATERIQLVADESRLRKEATVNGSSKRGCRSPLEESRRVTV